MQWLWRVLRRPELAPRPVAAASTPGPTVPLAVPPLPRAAAPCLLPWLLNQDLDADRCTLAEAEQRALQVLDDLLRRPATPADLLPRAGAVIPQLMAMLRRDDLALDALARQVGRDLVLAAEVLRMARAAGHGASDDGLDLPRALGRLGTAGLNIAIARVVLRPLFDSPGDGLFARAGERLWQHAEAQARHGSVLAAAEGIDAFEGYLAGLLHNSGWTVALRALDRGSLFVPPADDRPPAFGPAFALGLQRRCDALFGKLVAGWQITPLLTALAESAAAPGGLDASDLPLAALLRRADALAGQELIGSPATTPALNAA